MKSNFELVKEGFAAINSFKRSRALAEIARHEGETDKAIFHELRQYKNIDQLELCLRVIQSNEKGIRDEDESERAIRAVR